MLYLQSKGFSEIWPDKRVKFILAFEAFNTWHKSRNYACIILKTNKGHFVLRLFRNLVPQKKWSFWNTRTNLEQNYKYWRWKSVCNGGFKLDVNGFQYLNTSKYKSFQVFCESTTMRTLGL